MAVTVIYSQPINPRDISKWEKVGNDLFPKDFNNENVLVGTNTNDFDGNITKFLAKLGNTNIVLVKIAGQDFAGLVHLDTVNAINNNILVNDNGVLLYCDDNLGAEKAQARIEKTKIDIDVEDTATSELSNIDVDKLIISFTVADPVKNVNVQHTKEKFEINLVDNAGPPLNYILRYNLNGLAYNNGLADLFRVQNTVVNPSPLFADLPPYDDDAAAGAAGLTAGEFYQTTGAGAAPLNVPGIVMVKQ